MAIPAPSALQRAVVLAGLLWTCLHTNAAPGDSAEPRVVFQGWTHTALGGAILQPGPDGLRIANLGDSGGDGAAIDFQERVRRATLGFGAEGFAPAEPGQLTMAAAGTVAGIPGRVLGSLGLTWQPNQLLLSMRSGTAGLDPTLRLEVYQGSSLMGSANVPSEGPLGRLRGNTGLSSVTIGQAESGNAPWSLWDLGFAGPFQLTTTGDSFTGTRLRLLASSPSGALQNIETVALGGRNLGAVRLSQLEAPAFQPRLSAERLGGNLRLRSDSRNATLQAATRLSGPWSDLARGINSLDVPPQQPGAFFRLGSNHLADLALAAPRRNILFVIADDVGVDQLPVYIDHYAATARTDDDILVDTNIPPALTPTITQLAAAGVTFLNACSSPTCSPSRAGFFTGRRSFRHGVYDPVRPNLPGAETTIAQLLSPVGYPSGLFGKWHLGDPGAVPPGLGPLDFGWERHYGALAGELSTSYTNWAKVENTTAFTSTNHATRENVSDALTWIRGRGTSNWMATVAFNAPHWVSGGGVPIHLEMPPVAYRARVDDGGRGTYRSMLEHLDIQLARLLSGIPPLVLERTTIIFVGDNGTDDALGVNHHFAASHSKGTLYEGGINVPLIIADGAAWLHQLNLPFALPLSLSAPEGRVNWPGRRDTNLVQTMDLFATAAAIANASGTSGTDSISLIPYLRSVVAPPQRTHTLAETRSTSWTTCGDRGWNIALRDTTHKLHIRNYGTALESYELYDLSVDRWELNNIWNPADATLVAIRDTLRTAINAQLDTAACP